MRHFLGPFDFLIDVPNLIIPERFKRTRQFAGFVWRTILLLSMVYVAAAAIYYEFYLWSVDR